MTKKKTKKKDKVDEAVKELGNKEKEYELAQKELKRKEQEVRKVKKKLEVKQGAKTFRYVLPLISITGFIGIILETLFFIDADEYVKFLWIMIMGVGLLIEADSFSLIKNIKKKGLGDDNFARLVAVTIGLLATLTGMLTFPMWAFETPGFLAVKGTIAIISVAYIIIQTWLVR